MRSGRAAEAAAHYHESVKLWPLFGNTQKAAEAFLEAGDLEMALRFAENQVERSRRETGHQTEETADAHASLSLVQVACGDLAGAEVSARAALRIDRITGREKDAAHARHLSALGQVLIARRKIDEAGEVLERALPLARKTLGSKHSDLGPIYAGLAVVKDAQGAPKLAAKFERLRQRLPHPGP
ncbi:MAG: tetratricopeptide repeat protein [Pseudomonadota bacterium]